MKFYGEVLKKNSASIVSFVSLLSEISAEAKNAQVSGAVIDKGAKLIDALEKVKTFLLMFL